MCTCNCQSLENGKQCPDCAELVKPEAKVCRYCQYRFTTDKPKADFQPLIVEADRIATLIKRGRFLTQVIELTPEQIVITTPGPFGLSSQQEEIPWEKVAGFNYVSGIFWDSVMLETRGQTANVMGCLKKQEGEKIREILKQMKN